MLESSSFLENQRTVKWILTLKPSIVQVLIHQVKKKDIWTFENLNLPVYFSENNGFSSEKRQFWTWYGFSQGIKRLWIVVMVSLCCQPQLGGKDTTGVKSIPSHPMTIKWTSH